MTTLLETITNKAEQSFGQPITKDNFNQWCQHWIKTGCEWRYELAAQGLEQTALKIKGLIGIEIDILNRRRQVKFKFYKQFPLYADASFIFYEVGYDTQSYWLVPGTWSEL